MNSPILVISAPEVSLVIEFIGVRFPILWLLLLPFLFYLSITILFDHMFLTLSLAFNFYFAFNFYGGKGIKDL